MAKEGSEAVWKRTRFKASTGDERAVLLSRFIGSPLG